MGVEQAKVVDSAWIAPDDRHNGGDLSRWSTNVFAAAVFAVLTSPHFYKSSAVEVCELNHVIGADGEIRFSQLILWRWYDRYEHDTGHHVAQWSMLHDEPKVDPGDRRTRVTWRTDSEAYQVQARTYRETWTMHDPEVVDRDLWSIDARRPYFGR